MAKSTRSKSKRSFRRTKRETGVYAAVDAARLQRLSNKLKAKIEADKDGDAPMEEEAVVEGEGEEPSIVHVYSVTGIQTGEDYIELLYDFLPLIDANEFWERRLRFVWDDTDEDMDPTDLDLDALRDEWASSVGLETHDGREPECSQYEEDLRTYVSDAREGDYWVGHEDSDIEYEGAQEGGVEDASGVKYAW